MADPIPAPSSAEALPASSEAPPAPPAPLPVTWAEIRSAGILFGLFVVTIALAVLFARPISSGCAIGGQAADPSKPCLQAFEDPTDPTNSVLYIVLIIAFTFAILWIAKMGKKWLIRAIILGAMALTIAYVVYPLAEHAGALPHSVVGTEWLGYFDAVALSLSLLLAGGLTYAVHKHPEWYVVDTVGILVAAASAAVFGISLGIVPVLLLLVLTAVYDAIAVYRTKHMLALADSVIDLQLPVLLVIPKHRRYRFRFESARFKQASAGNKAEREAMFMGLGDLVVPTILAISAVAYLPVPGTAGLSGFGLFLHHAPAVGAALGTLAGYCALMAFVLRGNPQAGLPLLNGGAIVGFLAGLWMATGSLRFW